MQLAIGLIAVFAGVDLVLAGYTKRPFSRLLFGYWDKPGSSSSSGPATLPPGNAATGGVHAPQVQPQPRAGAGKGGRPG